MRNLQDYLGRYDGIAKAAIVGMDMFRGDAQSAIFAQHLVLATIPEVFRHEFEETKFVSGGLIPWDTSVPSGALQVGWNELSHTQGPDDGIIADDAEDVPAVELKGGFHTNRAVTVAKAFKYSLQDVETAQMQGTWSLITEKSTAVREEHDRDINNLVRNGNNDGSIPGFYRHPGITVSPATTGDWPTATPDEIVDDFNELVTAQMEATLGRGTPDTALFSINSWRRINTLQRSTASDITVLDFLKASNPFINRWDWENGLATAADAGSATTRACIVYRNSPSVIRGVLPLRLVPLPPQERGLTIKVIMRSRYAGIIVPKPKEIARLDGI